MGKTDDGEATPGAPDAGGSDTSASPEPAQPLGVLWSWTPGSAQPDIEPVEMPAPEPEPDPEPVVAQPAAPVGKLWNWTPEADSAAAEPTPEPAAPKPAAPVGKFWKRKPKAAPPAAETPPADRAADPTPEPVAAPPAAPVGKLWNAQPESTPAAVEVPLADRVAEVVREVEVASGITTAKDPSAGVLWSWTPPQTPDVELVETPSSPPDAPPDVEPVETPTAPPDAAPDVELVETPRPPPDAPPDVELVETPLDLERTTVRPVMSLDPDLVLPPPPALAPPIYLDPPEDDPWELVSPVRVRSRRGVRIALVALVLAVCAALPWAVPQIPDLFADAVPNQVNSPVNHDQPIGPPPPSPTHVDESLSGKRLASAGTPLEVTVDRLHVHSAVVPISGDTGELIPPNDPKILGWWQEGRGVGSATGSAVVTGHTVSGGGGAFDHLGELVPGDQINVRTDSGTIEYVVRESHDVSVDELARTAKSIFKQTGPGRLVLITCSDFNGTVYLSNSVVYASPVVDKPVAKR